MRFTIVQQLTIDATIFFDLLEGERLEEHVRRSSSSRRSSLQAEWEGGIFIRRTRVQPRRELPHLISKLLGPAGLSYVQTVHTERELLQNRWSSTLDRVGERVQIGGIEHVKNTSRGAELTIHTDVSVNVPLIQHQVEAGVRREIERVFERRRVLMEELNAHS